MVVETEHGHCGFVVDQVLGDHQTVIKNLGKAVSKCSGGLRRHHPGQWDRGFDSRSASPGAKRNPERVSEASAPKPAGRRYGRKPARVQRIPSAFVKKGKHGPMARKVNGKKQPRNSGNGGTAVLDYGARVSAPARAAVDKRRIRRCSGIAGDPAAGGGIPPGPPGRARQGRPVSRHSSRNGAGHQRDAGCDSAAHRRRQPHSGADLRRQDRRADRADLQGRSRKDEAGGQQRGHRSCRACRRSWCG